MSVSHQLSEETVVKLGMLARTFDHRLPNPDHAIDFTVALQTDEFRLVSKAATELVDGDFVLYSSLPLERFQHLMNEVDGNWTYEDVTTNPRQYGIFKSLGLYYLHSISKQSRLCLDWKEEALHVSPPSLTESSPTELSLRISGTGTFMLSPLVSHGFDPTYTEPDVYFDDFPGQVIVIDAVSNRQYYKLYPSLLDKETAISDAAMRSDRRTSLKLPLIASPLLQ
jgi:hypothetical protein